MLTVDKLGARVGRAFQLQEVSFTVAPGQVLAVLGPSGSGKSTLLRVVAGLATPRSGSVAWAGTPLSAAGRVVVPPEQRGIGMLFQEGVLFPHLDVRGNVALGLPRDVTRVQGAAKVDAALQTARIHTLADRPVTRLSGGEQQRVALARALVQEPRVLLLDEPFHSLDGPLKREILADFRSVVGGRNVATLLVTHSTEEAAAFADRIVLLCDGRVVQEGTMDTLYRAPANRWAATFLGEVQSLPVEQARAWGVGLPEGLQGDAWFRPYDVELGLADEASAFRVASVRALGAQYSVQVALPDGTRLTAHVSSRDVPRPGQRVRARVLRVLPPSVTKDATP